MSVECSKCQSYVCKLGRDDSPTENCPMHSDFPSFEELYSEEEQKNAAYQAALVEAEGYCEWTRIREIAEYALKLGVRRVGVAFCSDMIREAKLAASYLRDRDLDVFLPPESPGCDPIAQAEFFHQTQTQINVVCGMRVDHEALFIAASTSPVIVLVARDERLCHNPVSALYTSASYSRTRLFEDGEGPRESAFKGGDVATLTDVSREFGAELSPGLNRIQETKRFARVLGAKRIGISYCVGFRQEARLLAGVLVGNGFEVSSVCCKTGAVPKAKVGISDEEKVRPGEDEMICNPLAQAELLNRDEVHLTLILGQCVGHEAATLGSLKMPAFCIVAKDRVLGHNSVAALYQLEGAS